MKHIIIIILVLFSVNTFSQSVDSLTINNAIAKVLENNYGIKISESQYNIAKLNNNWGTTGILPSISVGGTTNTSSSNNDNDNYTSSYTGGSVNLDWILFRGFGAQISKKQLEEFEKLNASSLDVTVENTIVDVILAYYNVLLAKEKLSISEKNMNLSNDRYEIEKQKKSLGNSGTYELLQAQNSFLEDKSDYLSARSSFKNSVRQLNYLMAESLDKEYIFNSSFSIDTTNFNHQDLEVKMLENNNTIKMQYINLEIAKLDVRAAKSAYYPTLAANVSAGYSDNETDYETLNQMDVSVQGANTSASLALNYSIFEGGTRKRALQAAKIEQEIAEVEKQEMIQMLKNQLAQEYELYNVRKELLVLAEENLKAAELNLNLSKQKYDNGAINSFNYRDVQQLYYNVALNHQNAIFNLVQSEQTLMRLTGGIIENVENN